MANKPLMNIVAVWEHQTAREEEKRVNQNGSLSRIDQLKLISQKQERSLIARIFRQ